MDMKDQKFQCAYCNVHGATKNDWCNATDEMCTEFLYPKDADDTDTDDDVTELPDLHALRIRALSGDKPSAELLQFHLLDRTVGQFAPKTRVRLQTNQFNGAEGHVELADGDLSLINPGRVPVRLLDGGGLKLVMFDRLEILFAGPTRL